MVAGVAGLVHQTLGRYEMSLEMQFLSSDGKRYYQIGEIVQGDVTWTTDIEFNAGELSFSIGKGSSGNGIMPKNGDVIAMQWNAKNIFWGRIFKISYNSGGTIDITAYDKMRYLKGVDTIVWPANKASDRFRTVCAYSQITHKVVDDSLIRISARVDENKTYFTMLQEAISETRSKTDNRYYIRDNYGTVEFIFSGRTVSSVVLGDKSLMTTWSMDKSIEEAANWVVIKKIKDKNIQDSAIAKDDGNIQKWGKLHIIEMADEKMNHAQMVDRANQLLREKNRETSSLTLSAVGHLDIRAGVRFWLAIPELSGTKQVTAKKVSHKFGQNWLMTVEVEV